MTTSPERRGPRIGRPSVHAIHPEVAGDHDTDVPASHVDHSPALETTGLTKTFAGIPALQSLDLTVEPGEVHALLGENGSGKSTFIKILAGYHRPDAGAVSIGGERMVLGSAQSAYALGCRFVHQDLGLLDDLSVTDNLSLNAGFPTRLATIRAGASRRDAVADLARVGLDLDPRLAVSELSAAQRTGVAVARALRPDDKAPVRLLVLDEPTATLPDVEVRHLLDIIRQVTTLGVGVVYVTHRLDEVFQIASRTTVLRSGRSIATRPTSSLDRAGLVDLLVGSEFAEIQQASAHLPEPAGRAVLRVRGLRAPGVDGVDLDLHAGDVVGVAGITGSGRESLLGAVFGAIPREGGEVSALGAPIASRAPRAAIRAGVAYLPPDRKALGGMMDLTVRENLAMAHLRPLTRWGTVHAGRERQAVRQWFHRLDIRPGDGMERPLAALSGGNQQKALFAKWLRREPAVFLLDEPTQGVDVGAKALLHHQLVEAAARGMAVLISSSDVDELAALCRRVIVLRNGRVVAQLSGAEVTVPALSRAALGHTVEVAR